VVAGLVTASSSWALEVVVQWGSTAISYPSAREDGVRIEVRAEHG
jgi:hypothetical protein